MIRPDPLWQPATLAGPRPRCPRLPPVTSTCGKVEVTSVTPEKLSAASMSSYRLSEVSDLDLILSWGQFTEVWGLTQRLFTQWCITYKKAFSPPHIQCTNVTHILSRNMRRKETGKTVQHLMTTEQTTASSFWRLWWTDVKHSLWYNTEEWTNFVVLWNVRMSEAIVLCKPITGTQSLFSSCAQNQSRNHPAALPVSNYLYQVMCTVQNSPSPPSHDRTVFWSVVVRMYCYFMRHSFLWTHLIRGLGYDIRSAGGEGASLSSIVKIQNFDF